MESARISFGYFSIRKMAYISWYCSRNRGLFIHSNGNGNAFP